MSLRAVPRMGSVRVLGGVGMDGRAWRPPVVGIGGQNEKPRVLLRIRGPGTSVFRPLPAVQAVRDLRPPSSARRGRQRIHMQVRLVVIARMVAEAAWPRQARTATS